MKKLEYLALFSLAPLLHGFFRNYFGVPVQRFAFIINILLRFCLIATIVKKQIYHEQDYKHAKVEIFMLFLPPDEQKHEVSANSQVEGKQQGLSIMQTIKRRDHLGRAANPGLSLN